MPTDETKRAAQEFLAVRMSEETELQEVELNREAALRLAPKVWKQVAETFVSQCKAWNEILHEEALTCKETILGDLRIRCAGKTDQISVHYDSRKLQVTFKNTARPEHEKDSVFFIQGWASGTEAHLFRNNQSFWKPLSSANFAFSPASAAQPLSSARALACVLFCVL